MMLEKIGVVTAPLAAEKKLLAERKVCHQAGMGRVCPSTDPA